MAEILLPGGERPGFALAHTELEEETALACVIKDAGDDPDVTHGALICARVRRTTPGSGVQFKAGSGVGTITKPGLMLGIGEAAINPVPRQMMQMVIAEVAALYGVNHDIEIEISVPGGETLALKTLNPRLGIMGGISILGTTGIVIPYSCSAWIHSIHRGIDVARAEGIGHVAGATGNISEMAVQKLHNLPESALIDMGDFVGGMLKYLKKSPVERVTVAGGFGKMTKLAQGLLDLHSRAGAVDMDFLAEMAGLAGAPKAVQEQIRLANTAKHVLEISSVSAPRLPSLIADLAWKTAAKALGKSEIALEVIVFDRHGVLLARTPFQAASAAF